MSGGQFREAKDRYCILQSLTKAVRTAAMGRQGKFAGGSTGHSTVNARGSQGLPLDRL